MIIELQADLSSKLKKGQILEVKTDKNGEFIDELLRRVAKENPEAIKKITNNKIKKDGK